MAAPSPASRRFSDVLAERTGLAQFTDRLGHVAPLATEIFANGPPQRGIGDVVRRVRGLRQVTARDLVLALGAGLAPAQAALNGKVDGLVVANLEVQERMMFDRAPVAAEQG